MTKRPNTALIGAFVLGAVVIAVAAIVTLGSGKFFAHKQTFVLYFQGSVNGLEKGAPVKYRGVPIGSVSEILLALGEQPTIDPRIPVLIEIDTDRLLELGASRDLILGPAMMDQLRHAGLRGQLQSLSLITGLLYIQLDLFPNTPNELVLPPGGSYTEIPTLPTTLEQAQMKLEAIFARLSKIDFEGFGKSLNGVVDGLNHVVNSPDVHGNLVTLQQALAAVRDAAAEIRGAVKPLSAGVNGTTGDLRKAIDRLQATIDRLNSLTDPNAPLVHGLGRTLADLGEAARAVRQLAEDLDRDPSVLLKGKKAP